MNWWNEVEAVIEEKSLLKHAFYQAWTAGTLKRADLTHYARQYFQQESRFSRYLSSVHSNCEDLKVRQTLLENLRHEEEGKENHAELWLRFAEAAGASRDSVKNATMNPETRTCVEAFGNLARSQSWTAGLAALYAYEAQQPQIASAKIQGLKSHYKVDSAAGLKFFEIHSEVDQWHAESEKQILLDQAKKNPGLKKEIVASVSKACDALNTLLDGVCRERGIACSMKMEPAVK